MLGSLTFGPFLEVYSFEREIIQNRQYYIVSGITFWKCTPLLRTPLFCIYSNMAFPEVYSVNNFFVNSSTFLQSIFFHMDTIMKLTFIN